MAVNLYNNLKETKNSKNLSLKLSIKHGKTITLLQIFKKWLAPRNVRLSRSIVNTFFFLFGLATVFTLNFLPYKPTGGPVSSNIYRPTINSTGSNLKTTLMTINSNHQNSKHDDVPNIMWTCQLCIR